MKPIKVLLVEDEKVLLAVLHHNLSKMVREVYTAPDGAQGLQMYLEHRPDLVITDIRMPLMSGLDMTARIREVNPDARVIVLSAYSESHYFTRAIDLGVKAYLIKPVREDQLLNIVSEQAHDILLEQKVQQEERLRREAEANLQKSEQILNAVSKVAELLLSSRYGSNPLPIALSILGNAAKVSRVYIFENFEKDGIAYTGQTYEWTAEGIKPELDNPLLKQVPLKGGAFERWARLLSKGEPVYGLVSQFPEDEQEILYPQEIRSLLAMPITVNGVWHGFMGLDECHYDRVWSQSELSSLFTACKVIGAAIERQQTERQLIHLNKTLEERVRERTKKLQLEVNERKMAEQLLRQSEEKYRIIFENANDGIVLSTRGIIAFINPRFFELTGYLPNSLVGRRLTDIVADNHKETVHTLLQRAETGERYVPHADVEFITSTGHRHWVEIKCNTVQWDDEPAVLTIIADINQRKLYESELRDLNTNLEQRVQEVLRQREQQQQKIMHKSRLESLGELATGIAHEINQPIGGLSMSLDNILDQLQSGALTQAYLERKISTMFADIDRVKQIINHVRVFAREQDPQLRKPFSINEVIENTLRLIERSYTNNQILVSAQYCSPDVTVIGNPMRLEQVLLNLFSNAKFAVEQKRNTQPAAYQPKISIDCRQHEQMVEIRMTDNGTGIPSEIVHSIFDPFFTSKKADEGTGLGLSISYGIISEMGGTIEVDTQLGQYTSMIIRLPLHTLKA